MLGLIGDLPIHRSPSSLCQTMMGLIWRAGPSSSPPAICCYLTPLGPGILSLLWAPDSLVFGFSGRVRNGKKNESLKCLANWRWQELWLKMIQNICRNGSLMKQKKQHLQFLGVFCWEASNFLDENQKVDIN